MSDQQYETCGGCGATHPDQRCIGCLHYFGGDSWGTRRIYEKIESGANAAADSPALAQSNHEEAAQGAENDV